MTYELWDLRHRNSLGALPSRERAFEVVRAIVDAQPDLTETLGLDGDDEAGRQVPSSRGQELADLARYLQSA